jgi:copper homeostasis protein (lipoprotein)
MFLIRIAAALLFALLAGCAAKPPIEQLRAALPATYVGTLPCADCPGLDYTLRLRPDGVYFLRRDYLERGSVDEIGRWLPSSDAQTLVLQGGDRFAIDSAAQLTLRDRNGAAIVSRHNYSLRRLDTAAQLEPTLKLRGAYVYLADSAIFTECRTGLRFAVLPGAGAHAAERAYLAGRGAPGEPLLVEIEGRLTEAVVMEGQPQPAVEVLRFLQVRPEPDCAEPFVSKPLDGTAWVVEQLGGQALGDEAGRRPSLQFDAAQRRVSGFTGCNRLIGEYRQKGDALAFGELAATRMACPGATILEVTFTDALKATVRHVIAGDRLELYDAEGTLLMRLAAEPVVEPR